MSSTFRNFVVALQNCSTETENVILCQKMIEQFNNDTKNSYLVNEMLQEILIMNTLNFSIESQKFFIISQASKSGIVRTATTTLLNVLNPNDEMYLLLHTNTILISLLNPFSNPLNTICSLRTLKLYINNTTSIKYLNSCLTILNQAFKRPSNESSILRQTLGVLPIFIPFLAQPYHEKIFCEIIKTLQHKNPMVLESAIAALYHLSNITSINMNSCIEPIIQILNKLLKCQPIAQIQNISYPFIISNILKLLLHFNSIPNCFDDLKEIITRFSHQLTDELPCTLFINCLLCINKFFPKQIPRLETLPLESLLLSSNSIHHRAYLKIISISHQFIQTNQNQIIKLFMSNDPLTSVDAFKLLLPQTLPIIHPPPSLVFPNTYLKNKLITLSINYVNQFQKPVDPDSIIALLNCFPSDELLSHVSEIPIKESLHTIVPQNALAQVYCTLHNIQINTLPSQKNTLVLLTLKSESKSSLPLTLPTHTFSLEMKQRLHEYKMIQTLLAESK